MVVTDYAHVPSGLVLRNEQILTGRVDRALL